MAGTQTGAVCKEVQLVRGALIERLCGELSPMGGAPHWRGEECEESFLKREGVSETPCDEMCADNIP